MVDGVTDRSPGFRELDIHYVLDADTKEVTDGGEVLCHGFNGEAVEAFFLSLGGYIEACIVETVFNGDVVILILGIRYRNFINEGSFAFSTVECIPVAGFD